MILLGGFPGLVLGLWASLTPLESRRWTLLSLFGVGGLIGLAGGLTAVVALIARLEPLYAAGWIVALLSASLFATVGLWIGRLAAWAICRLRQARLHHGLFAMAFGLLVGLTTGAMFAAVTVGSSALKKLLDLPLAP